MKIVKNFSECNQQYSEWKNLNLNFCGKKLQFSKNGRSNYCLVFNEIIFQLGMGLLWIEGHKYTESHSAQQNLNNIC